MAEIKVQPQNPGVSQQQEAIGNGGSNQFQPMASVSDCQNYGLFQRIVPCSFCSDWTRAFRTKASLERPCVNYRNAEGTCRALRQLDFTDRDPSICKSGPVKIFLKNLDRAIDSKALYHAFSVFGTIISCKIAADASGQSKGYGFVIFEQDEAAQIAIEKLNGMLINCRQVYVGPFITEQERVQADGKAEFNADFVQNSAEVVNDEDFRNYLSEFGTSEMRERIGKLLKMKLSNLYIKHLDDSIDDDRLKELFSVYGTITSCKVMKDNHGHSKGFGFVDFSSPYEAARALAEMNRKIIVSKPLYVAPAERKDERRARLQVYFSQLSL